MKGPESNLTARILRALRAIPRVHAEKQHGSRFGTVGRPDLFICAAGTLVVLEVKTPTGRVTPAQTVQLALWRNAGAVASVVRSVDEAVAIVQAALGSRHAA